MAKRGRAEPTPCDIAASRRWLVRVVACVSMAVGGCGGISVRTEELPPDGCLVRSDEFLVLENDGRLWGYAPATAKLRLVGQAGCPGVAYAALAAMASGDAYVADVDGQIFHVSDRLACDGPVFGSPSFDTFWGMTQFVNDEGAESVEFTEYDPSVNVDADRLGSIDLATGNRTSGPLIAGQRLPIEPASGDDGRLFAVNMGNYATQKSLVEIDPTTGATKSERPFGAGISSGSAGLARSGDYVYAFVASGSESASTFRFDVDGGAGVELGHLPIVVVGAGSSSCAASREQAAGGSD